MLHKTAVFRTLLMPACLLCGLLEFLALQRARWLRRRAQF